MSLVRALDGPIEDEVRRSFGIVEEGVELDAEMAISGARSLRSLAFSRLLKLFRGEVFGVEAVLAGVLVAGLAAGLEFRLFVTFVAAEVVEGALGGFFGDSDAVEEVFHFFVYLFYISHKREGSRGWGFWAT